MTHGYYVVPLIVTHVSRMTLTLIILFLFKRGGRLFLGIRGLDFFDDGAGGISLDEG